MEFARSGKASDPVRRFEHQHSVAMLRKIGRTHQAIVTGANDDRVVAIQIHLPILFVMDVLSV